ncbi:MAG TPA: NACHT domain-containing protein [Actinocrinis sp.]
MDPVVEFIINIIENVLGELVARVLEALGRRARSVDVATPDTALAAAIKRGVRELPSDAFAGIDEQDIRAAAEEVRACLAAAAPLTVDEVIAAGLRHADLEQIIRERAGRHPRGTEPGDAVERVFDLLLGQISGALMEELRRLPQFQLQLIEATFLQTVAVHRSLREIAGSDARGWAAAAARYERRHHEHVAEFLGRFELFGVVRGRAPRKQTFRDAYVSPAVARAGGSAQGPDYDDELTGAGLGALSAFADFRRVLLRGSAGIGKTTLLQWIAADRSACQLRGEPDSWGECVPFLIRLRDFAGRQLPEVEQLPAATAPAIAGERPPGWATAKFLTGAALLLIDGVDEVPAEQRQQVHDWLESLALAYPEARYVVTVRPFAVPRDWLADARFEPFDLLPLSPKGIRDFLACWHDAARREYGQDSETQQWLDQCEANLAVLMSTRTELRRLAESPLLCGLLCALYQDRDMELPRDRKSLFDEALKLLLERWDQQRGVRLEGDVQLDLEEQIALLQRLAYSMVLNQEQVVADADAVRRIEHAMRGLRSRGLTPDKVLMHLLERTGLLQEPGDGQVQFVHRTFRDYLAAKEAVESGFLGHLVEHAHLDQWHEVLIMAVAHARPAEREEVLGRLISGSSAAAHGDPRVRDRLHLLAAACLDQASVMQSDGMRGTVEAAAARLIPPTTFEDAEYLARAGRFVLDLLPGPQGLTEHEAACVVRTIAMIGGTESLDRLGRFAEVNQPMVIDELMRAWRVAAAPEEYARTVLAEIEFGDPEVTLRGWHRLQYADHLTKLRSLRCVGDFTPLTPISGLPQLRRLTLDNNLVLRDLSPLADAPALESLHLVWCTVLRDLSPLRRFQRLHTLHLTACKLVQSYTPLVECTVESLSLHLMEHCDLTSLAGAQISDLTIRDRRLARGLHIVPAELPLRRLALDNLPQDRDLRGVERWRGLESLACRDVPHDEEIAQLQKLPQLAALTVWDPADDTRVAALRAALPEVAVTVMVTGR